jgi:hypothetical protein
MVENARLLLLLGLVLIQPLAAESLSREQAVHRLTQRLSHDHIYNSACVAFETEDEDDHDVFIAVREIHGGQCPGDPQTSPVLARFRVSRTTAKMAWHDDVSDEWRPYSSFLKDHIVKP